MSTPRVTVGLMVYNEARHIDATLRSLRAQTEPPFEILVGDNASTDGTSEIVDRHAAEDRRIRVIRHPANIGALANFNTLVREARGEYFVLAGGHDKWSDGFLPALCRALDEHPDAVLASAVPVPIDDAGERLPRHTGFLDTGGMSALQRFYAVLWGNQDAMYGMYRLSALRRTRLQMNFIGSGAVLLGELALLGTFVIVSNAIWYRREVRMPETTEDRFERYLRILFPPGYRGLRSPLRIPFALVGAIWRAELSLGMRLRLTLGLPAALLRYIDPIVYHRRHLK